MQFGEAVEGCTSESSRGHHLPEQPVRSRSRKGIWHMAIEQRPSLPVESS